MGWSNANEELISREDIFFEIVQGGNHESEVRIPSEAHWLMKKQLEIEQDAKRLLFVCLRRGL